MGNLSEGNDSIKQHLLLLNLTEIAGAWYCKSVSENITGYLLRSLQGGKLCGL